MEVLIKDKGWSEVCSSRNLIMRDGEKYLMLKIYRDNEEECYGFCVDDEVVEQIIKAFNQSKCLNGYWINTR